jgi:DNA-binding transcriptional ArsR family regulator
MLMQMAPKVRLAMNPREWKALAEPTRWAMVLLLSEKPRSVTELCDELVMSQPGVSWHLDVLRRAGLVRARKSGYFSIYELVPREFNVLAARLAAIAKRAVGASDRDVS